MTGSPDERMRIFELDENGWGQTPRNARFSGISAMSTTRMTSESGSSPANYCFRADAETGAANDERERERQGMKEITRKQFTLGKQRLLGRKAIPMAARAVSFYCSPDAAAMFGTNSKSPTDQSR